MYIGDYYNWYAATAETGGYDYTKIPTDDICPKGWELPKIYQDATSSWRRLISDAYNLTPYSRVYGNGSGLSRVVQLPLSIPLSGFYEMGTGALANRGYSGFYWYGTPAYNMGRALILQMGRDGSLSTQTSGDSTARGMSVRCVNKGSNQETVVSTCAANSICYNSNGGSGSMDNQSVTAAETPADTSAMLTAPSFTRTGYAFAGWSTSSTGYGTTYGPNETVTVGDLSSGGLQLYAKWIKSSGTMQEFTATQCSTMKEHEVIALTDNRDGNTYSVAKLKDGNCWMTSNLALNLAEFAGTQLLTPDNTDLNSSEAITRGYWDPGESTKEKWTTTYVAELDARNLTRDFTGLSTLLLGQAQPNQFQTSDDAQPTGWWWGSKVSDDGTYTLQSSFINFSPNAAIPRSYISPTTKSYNRYAAFAESYPDHNSSDTVCPSGWRIPTYNSQDIEAT